MNENSLVTSFFNSSQGPNKENFEKKFYRQCKLGCGPQQREFRKEILQAMQVGDRPTKRISKRNSTGNASCGDNTEADEKSAYNASWDRPQQREIGFPISTDNASRRGPNTEAVTNDKILLHNKSLVVLYHYCLLFLLL